jgi:1-acyl-sn-glycerol-3-phosphate acyltransferase
MKSVHADLAISAIPRRSAVILASALLRIAFRRNFHSIRVFGDFTNLPTKVILVSNHLSWWDGFLLLYLTEHLLKRTFYVAMLERELSSRKFLRWLGAFSINPESSRRSVRYIDSLITNPWPLAVALFPQGEIRPDDPTLFQCRHGLSLLRSPDETAILPLSIKFHYGSYRVPSVYITLGTLFTLGEYKSKLQLLDHALISIHREAAERIYRNAPSLLLW